MFPFLELKTSRHCILLGWCENSQDLKSAVWHIRAWDGLWSLLELKCGDVPVKCCHRERNTRCKMGEETWEIAHASLDRLTFLCYPNEVVIVIILNFYNAFISHPATCFSAILLHRSSEGVLMARAACWKLNYRPGFSLIPTWKLYCF